MHTSDTPLDVDDLLKTLAVPNTGISCRTSFPAVSSRELLSAQS